jgi:hypothetical protein
MMLTMVYNTQNYLVVWIRKLENEVSVTEHFHPLLGPLESDNLNHWTTPFI